MGEVARQSSAADVAAVATEGGSVVDSASQVDRRSVNKRKKTEVENRRQPLWVDNNY